MLLRPHIYAFRLKRQRNVVDPDHVTIQRAKIIASEQAPYPFMPLFIAGSAVLSNLHPAHVRRSAHCYRSILLSIGDRLLHSHAP